MSLDHYSYLMIYFFIYFSLIKWFKTLKQELKAGRRILHVRVRSRFAFESTVLYPNPFSRNLLWIVVNEKDERCILKAARYHSIQIQKINKRIDSSYVWIRNPILLWDFVWLEWSCDHQLPTSKL